ncbi:hypothetical protein [Asticcacaulis benevestitus]|uniref:Uncharacterized protein n=1 Tax=Asticcacaulis benevestitus DSM 16100 = ATCC BAA-896 TaxID=1121022 RepID=V4Q3D6_9CAUL|nr:hypothetical protein [Asticcacaulis benevestitus]ESQ92370.1 hypothetical protein ABENE_08315 [Asticcacaulis benevestitus DSM 16100 = ATCC BAA-896]
MLTHSILPAILAALSLWLLVHFDRLNRGNIDHIRGQHGAHSPVYAWFEKTCGSARFALTAIGWIAFNRPGIQRP